MTRPARRNGFTLIEMTLVLAILALLLGGMMPPLAAQIDLRNRRDTERRLEEARDALIGFALANRRLPRPAVSASDGGERGPCAAEAECAGFLPSRTLGIVGTDGWGKLIRYSVSPAFAGGAGGSQPISLAGTPTKLVQTRVSATAPLSTLVSGVPAVFLSHGRDNWGSDIRGTPLADASASNIDEDANASAVSLFIARDPALGRDVSGGEFDDLVAWLPSSVLFARMAAAGVLP